MKNLIILTLSLLFWTYKSKPSLPQPKFIEIVGIGVQNAIPKQSFIVIDLIDWKMIREKMRLTDHPDITDEKLRLYWGALYDTIITDSVSFSQLCNFVEHKGRFLTNDLETDCRYAIIINGERHDIINKS